MNISNSWRATTRAGECAESHVRVTCFRRSPLMQWQNADCEPHKRALNRNTVWTSLGCDKLPEIRQFIRIAKADSGRDISFASWAFDILYRPSASYDFVMPSRVQSLGKSVDTELRSDSIISGNIDSHNYETQPCQSANFRAEFGA